MRFQTSCKLRWPNGGVEYRWGRHKSQFSGYRSTTAEVRTTTATVYRALSAQTATHQRIYVYHNQRGPPRRREENRTEFIYTQR